MTTSRDLDLAQAAYRRGLVDWPAVVRVESRLLPPCQRCGHPANFGGWAPGERLCADCADDKRAALAVRLGRAPTLQELSM